MKKLDQFSNTWSFRLFCASQEPLGSKQNTIIFGALVMNGNCLSSIEALQTLGTFFSCTHSVWTMRWILDSQLDILLDPSLLPRYSCVKTI